MPKSELSFSQRVLNAAGSLGFAPEGRGVVDLSRLGAFVTNPVSLAPRSPAQGRRCLTFPGGFLLHTGYPNPGLKAVLQRYSSRWASASLPVIVHLLAQSPGEAAALVRRLEGVEGVMGVELGLPPGTDPEEAQDWVAAAAGELPVILRLPLERASELAGKLAETGVGSAVAAFSLSPPRGTLPGPQGSLIRGRLYGPAIFPMALSAVEALVRAGLPAIGGGGVYSHQQLEAMLAAGAMAVQVDGVLWKAGNEWAVSSNQ